MYLQLNELVKGVDRISQGFKNYYSLYPIVQKWLSKIDWYVLERLNLFWNKQRNLFQFSTLLKTWHFIYHPLIIFITEFYFYIFCYIFILVICLHFCC
nr:hypothetical protein [Bacillus sp. 123MFChir2]